MRRLDLGAPEGAASVDVDGVTIAVSRTGQGAPVVCLSAIGHGSRDFELLAARVKHRVELICVDWPGHGRSGAAVQPPSARAYAELLCKLLPALGIKRPILVGNSIGGAAAILYAAKSPVRGLVLCDSGGLVEVTGAVRWVTRAFAAFFTAGERGAAWFAGAYALYYRMLVLPSSAARAQRRRVVAAGREMAGQLRQAWESFGRPEADIRATAQALDVPIWVAWARSDRVIPLSFCRPAISGLRNAVLTTFAGGHSPFLEDPDAFAEGFMDLVDTLDQRDRVNPAA